MKFGNSCSARSRQQALRIIQGNVPAAAAGELQEAKHATGHAARSIERAYSPTPGPTAAEDGYTPVTGADEIKAMPHGTELVVEGTVYRVSRMTGCQTYVRNLQGTAFTPPAQFIEVFAGTPIYRRPFPCQGHLKGNRGHCLPTSTAYCKND